MIQDTSLDAWISISQNLGDKQKIVFEALRNNPASDKTLAARLGWSINRITPRRGELVKKGIVKEMYREVKGGHSAKVWGVSL